MKWLNFWRRQRHQVVGDEEDFLLVTWDSCRYDTFLRAKTPRLDQFCLPRRAWAMATYTIPAHGAMFQGFLPHAFEPEPFYNRFCQQLWRISHHNLNVTPLVTFPEGTKNIVAGFCKRGYFTAGVSRELRMPREGFERFEITGTAARKQNCILARLITKAAAKRPCFAFVNYGETHSPFCLDGRMDWNSPVGKQFNLRRLFNQPGVLAREWQFDEDAFAKQVACAEYLDERTGELLDFFSKRGRPTTVVVCGDHGECLGENGLYGHGFYHEKVMEVPLLIFRLGAPPHPAPKSSLLAPRMLEVSDDVAVPA